MADKILKSMKFPGLEDTYVIPDPTDEIDAKVSEAETDMLSVLSGATAVQTLSDNKPYLFRQTPKAGHSEFDTLVGGSVAWNQLCNSASVTVPNGHKYYMIKGGTASLGASSGSAITGLTSGTDIVIDLTQLFGSTVADAIYAMEQATAGSGVAYFRSLFGEDYYEYNAGELKSVEGVSAHVMRDADDNIIGNYPLDSTLTLRGIPKWNNGLYYDGDVYEADGTVTRRFGVVDLGTFTWSADGAGWVTTTPPTNIKNSGAGHNDVQENIFISNGLTTRLFYKSGVDSAVSVDKSVALANSSNGAVYVHDSALDGKTAAQVKTAMSGIYLVYELATKGTESAQPYQKAQICDPSGTEEYVSTSIVPVGHNTDYPMTITDIAPTSNGTYTLKCTVSGGVKTYEWASA